MEVAMIRFISKVKVGFLILLAVLSILIGSFTLFGKKSYADVPTWETTICTGIISFVMVVVLFFAVLHSHNN
jgi:hypothetical protein